MLASLSQLDGRGNTIVVQLPNGRKIVGMMDEKDQIHVTENTTGLSIDVAEVIVGIAYDRNDKGDDTIVWRRLVELAEKCHKKLQASRYSLN